MIINHLFTTLYYNVDVENIVVVVVVVARMKLKIFFFSFILLYIHSLLYYLPVFHSSGLKRWNCSAFKKFSFFFLFFSFISFYFISFIIFALNERNNLPKRLFIRIFLSFTCVSGFYYLLFFSSNKVWLFVVVVVFLRKKTVNETKIIFMKSKWTKNIYFQNIIVTKSTFKNNI